MKKILLLISMLFLTNNSYAQFTVNGILDSTISMTAVENEFSYGVEEFANIRFQSRLRDNRAVFYGAVNLFAVAGDYALAYDDSVEENYIAGIELERLYFRLNFEKANFDGGLFRLPFGYSQVWGSSDFLNPKNPLKPDARPRGVLGAALSVFPKNDIKLLTFAAAPRDPFLNDGSGVLIGISLENHWRFMSAQALYSFEVPNENEYSKQGLHRAGLSVKADIKVGIVIDALFTYNPEAETEIDGLSFSAGIDYSFIDGKLVVLAEYLYNGENSSTAFHFRNNPLGMPERHYLYSSLAWLFNDFTNVNFALISCLDNVNHTPMVTFNHELFQGASLIIMAQADLDNEIYAFSARLRLRF